LAENESIANIHRRLTNAYGDMAVDKSTVNRWAKRLVWSEQGEDNVSDLPRLGREGAILTDVLPRGQRIISNMYVETKEVEEAFPKGSSP
jgi:hypothetical protein